MTPALHYSVRNSERLSRSKGKRSRTRERQKKSKLDRYLANKERILKLISPHKKINTSGESLADEE